MFVLGYLFVGDDKQNSSELCLSEGYPALLTCTRAWSNGVNETDYP
jgi:hypothetical protein